MFRATAPHGSRWATREIAALDFLLNIPLEAEESIVRAGLKGGGREGVNGESKKSSGLEVTDASGCYSSASIDRSSEGGLPTTRWWEKLVEGHVPGSSETYETRRARLELEETELERPESQEQSLGARQVVPSSSQHGVGASVAPRIAPGRRLEGRNATVVQIPRDVLTVDIITSHRIVARQAAVREWEVGVAHGILSGSGRKPSPVERLYFDGDDEPRGLLDGRGFFSCASSYPVNTFSVIKYQPKKEEAARRRKRVEELGGGGTQFVMPERDWRGISYRALLPRVHRKNNGFRRTMRLRSHARKRERRRRGSGDRTNVYEHTVDISHDDTVDSDGDTSMSMMSSSSEESDGYVPGFVDDPEMVQGRHRHVMVGDRVTGCVVSSTIQFVKPADLKADLNKQFKDRFDGWEPAKEQRKFIGARVIDGVYTLSDPTEVPSCSTDDVQRKKSDEDYVGRRRKGSAAADIETIRMPPSLTLSKIRRLKQQALVACVRAKMEVSTVALACVYFERLCLDCRVDKSNRKLVFAACLLLASKINEKNVAIVHGQSREVAKKGKGVLPSFIKPTKIGKNQFASLFEFFTHEWSISLKSLFAAEWGVFAALGFNLQAKPSHVAFHFKRFLKVLEWNSLAYLGQEQYSQWQRSLDDEATRLEEHLQRKQLRREHEDRKLLDLQRDYHKHQQGEEAVRRRSPSYMSNSDSTLSPHEPVVAEGADTNTDAVLTKQAHLETDLVAPSHVPGRTSSPGKAVRGMAMARPSAGAMKSIIPGFRRAGGVAKPISPVSSVENLVKLAQTSHEREASSVATLAMRQSRSTPSLRTQENTCEDRSLSNPSVAIDMEKISETHTENRAGSIEDIDKDDESADNRPADHGFSV